jgi:D-tyrosyl-tRNA(Tyr) deacylase
MRAVVQRVSRAEVRVEGKVVGRIGVGLLVYVGVGPEDNETDAEVIANKLRYLRIFSDNEGKMNLDVMQAGGAILLISSFSLYADTRQGRRPAFTGAAPPEEAHRLFETLGNQLRALGLQVECGMFGRHMHIESINDGPVNILLETRLAT